MGNFWYPYHWSDLAPEAFTPAPAEHDTHGFGSDFVARQEDRDRYLEDYLNNLAAGSGKRYATVVVAASDSLHHTASDADYVCTGTGDESTINAAIAVAQKSASPTWPGTVLLMEGNYSISASIVISGVGGINLIGMGRLCTDITPNASGFTAIILQGNYHTVKHLAVSGQGSGGIDSQGYDTVIEDCFVSASSPGIHTSVSAGSLGQTVRDNLVWTKNAAGSIAILDDGSQSVISRNEIVMPANGTIGVKVTAGESTITGNTLRGSGNLDTNGILVAATATNVFCFGNTAYQVAGANTFVDSGTGTQGFTTNYKA